MATGAAWMVGFNFFDKLVGLASTLILARLLTPADFGLVAMSTSVVALLSLTGAFSLDFALIQRQDAERRHYDTAWTINVLLSAFVAVLLLALAVPAASYFRESRLELILPVLACATLVGGFENVGTVRFRKDLNFKKEFLFLLVKRLAAIGVTLPLAFAYRNVWALIAGLFTARISAVVISYAIQDYRPRFSLAARAELLKFGRWLFLSNLTQFARDRATDFILGRIVGSHGLGIYNMAKEIAAMPSTEVIAPLNRAVYPAYAKLSADPNRLCERFLDVFGSISLIAVPASVGLFCVAGVAVPVMLGQQWLEAVPIMQVAGLSGLMMALQSNMYWVFVALGNPRPITLMQTGVIVLVALPATVLGAQQFGAIGAAYAYSLAAIISLVGTVYVFVRSTTVSMMQIWLVSWRPLVASVIMALAVRAVQQTEPLVGAVGSHEFLRLIVMIVVGAAAYSISVAVLWLVTGRPYSAEQKLYTLFREKAKAAYCALLAEQRRTG